MPKLTLTIPTFNEEKSIHYPLDSAYDLVDEVVIVDGGSEDKTLDIARSYGDKVKIFEVDNPPNFLKNKQRAIEYATGDWILQLDADEALSDQLKLEIRNWKLEISHSSFLISHTQAINGYWIPRKNWFLGRFLMKGGVYPDSVLRLYRRGKAHFALKDVHEHAIVEGEVGTLKNPMEHWADPTFERYLTRWNRYTTFDSEKLKEKREELCFFCYFVGKPFVTFFSIYFRHKGFMDGFPGFVWALFSSIRWWAIYIKAKQLEGSKVGKRES